MAMKCNPCDCLEQYYRDNTTFKKGVLYLLCKLIESIVGGGELAPKEAEYLELVPVAAAMGAAYTAAVVLPANTREVRLDNQTNGDVMVSMDNGATDSYHIPGGQHITLHLADMALYTGTTIALKDGTSASTTGTFYISAIW